MAYWTSKWIPGVLFFGRIFVLLHIVICYRPPAFPLASPACTFDHLTFGGWAPRNLTLHPIPFIPGEAAHPEGVYASFFSSRIVAFSGFARPWMPSVPPTIPPTPESIYVPGCTLSENTTRRPQECPTVHFCRPELAIPYCPTHALQSLVDVDDPTVGTLSRLVALRSVPFPFAIGSRREGTKNCADSMFRCFAISTYQCSSLRAQV
jgi:hypothetical protein